MGRFLWLTFGWIFLGAFAPALSWAQVTPLSPGHFQATFQANGNYTSLRWEPRGEYQVKADLYAASER